ncbi:hypothetical protein [Actinomadura litoris]|uniref:Uncharacterized protein n=1 Tax=Actinomadura litoris TaxID=2678616 RepID=A0A7K1LAE5_9ACTN|nr:hypothetical protein [Actinomadura litoris]MUN41407.1 hypothetical protein [Actinomadura litoris]
MAAPEYEYVALQEIWHGGVRAYHVGDPVPAENVEAHGYSAEQVAKVDTKAAAQAAEQATQNAADAVPAEQGPAKAAKTAAAKS